MASMSEDRHRERVEAYALGTLDGAERLEFERHLSSPCERCRVEVATYAALLQELPRELAQAPPDPRLRRQLLDLAEAPRPPLDLLAYDWVEPVPGVKLHLVKEDPSRNMRAFLVWARPGARHPRHRHLGDENILVLQGALRDERGTYGPGELCRSRTDSVHSEEALSGEECVCYVIYYGELEMLDQPR
jgi:anti-sigma factor ChrR (cupin superfamily)